MSKRETRMLLVPTCEGWWVEEWTDPETGGHRHREVEVVYLAGAYFVSHGGYTAHPIERKPGVLWTLAREAGR